ncbi:MAG: DUF4097 family beta strand repeat-containing protein [Bacteroidota bacterium]
MKKKTLFTNTLLIAFLMPLFLHGQEVNETYKDVAYLDVELATGEVTIKKSKNSQVSVRGKYDDDRVKVTIDYSGNSLSIKEKNRYGNNNGGRGSIWTIEVPDGLDISASSGTGDVLVSGIKADFEGNSGTGDVEVADIEGRIDLNSGTGSVIVRNAKGRFDLNSGTSNVLVSNAEGKFDANSGTGNVKFEKVHPTSSSTLNSGTGNVKFVLSDKLEADLELNSGTGDAVLDFDGQKVEGDFEMSCGLNSGTIVAPFQFDTERKVGSKYNGHWEKTAKVGKAEYDVEVSTGTGRAEIRS